MMHGQNNGMITPTTTHKRQADQTRPRSKPQRAFLGYDTRDIAIINHAPALTERRAYNTKTTLKCWSAENKTQGSMTRQQGVPGLLKTSLIKRTTQAKGQLHDVGVVLAPCQCLALKRQPMLKRRKW
jgi:hypothetical protein